MSDFDCCKDGKCDGLTTSGPRIYSTDIHGVGIRREPDWVTVEDLEAAGRKVFVTKGEERD